MHSTKGGRSIGNLRSWRNIAMLFLTGIAIMAFMPTPSIQVAEAAGSGQLYPAGLTGYRGNIEWRTSSYGGGKLKRRTLFYTFLEAGDSLLLGSSAVGIQRTDNGVTTRGDVLVFAPGRVSGAIGNEVLDGGTTLIPDAAGSNPNFSCNAARAVAGAPALLGQIRSRAAEIAGPLPATNGYIPCVYVAPAAGLYNIIFTGPAGGNSDLDIQPTGEIELSNSSRNFGGGQGAAVAAWDITVRDSGGNNKPGRAFTYYISANVGANNRPVHLPIYVATHDGYKYRIDLNGLDPWGFLLYANRTGFYDSDGVTPLYHDVMTPPTLSGQEANQLTQLLGGVSLALPEYPIYSVPLADETLNALGIPTSPVVPDVVSTLTFTGTGRSDNNSLIGTGGTLTYTTQTGVTDEIVISRDGVNFDPNNPANAVLRGSRAPGMQTIAWNGYGQDGTVFPVGTYTMRVTLHGGEIHFPILDSENSTLGGPTITLLNPVIDCPVGPNGNPLCTAAYYDDRGYRTQNGTLVGELNSSLCPGSPGNPPVQLISGFNTNTGILPFDSSVKTDTNGNNIPTQRAYGDPSLPRGGNASQNCSPNGSFGDAKGLDFWAYVPGEQVEGYLRIFQNPTAISLSSFSATREDKGVALRWTTGSEINSFGFKILRSTSRDRASATELTIPLVPSKGGPNVGATYQLVDRSAQPGTAYYYWLVEVENTGKTQEFGPFGITEQ